jgi:hypothetical protein
VRIRPGGHPEVKPFTRALMQDGIPFTMFAVDECRPSTSGNLIAIAQYR